MNDSDSYLLIQKSKVAYSYFSLDNYLWMFPVAMLCYSYASYYFYNLVRRFYYKINHNPEDETKIEQSKNELFKNISVYCLLKVISLFFCFCFGNPYYHDFTSFLLTVFNFSPIFLLLSILLYHVSFLIEKYYQITTKKSDIFFSSSIEVINVLIYILYSLFTFGCLLKQRYNTYYLLCNGIIGFISAFISILYFYYGVKLANVYSIKMSNNSELREKKFLHSRLMTLSIAIGTVCIVKSFISCLICLNVFENGYPEIMQRNLWDVVSIFAFEFSIVILLGNTKQSKDGISRPSPFSIADNEILFDYSFNNGKARNTKNRQYAYFEENNHYADPLLN